MLDNAVLIAQAVFTLSLGTWMFAGVRDNILHPDMNRLFVAQVLRLDRIREDYPDDYAHISHRAIHNETVHLWMFRLVVLIELVACIALLVSAGLLFAALAGFGGIETARSIAILSTLIFTSIWCGFVIVGNHFAYWYCHEGAQVTHFHLALLGLGNMIFLAVA